MEVFDNEMFAIWMALKVGVGVAHWEDHRTITIRADNQGAMRRVTQSFTGDRELMARIVTVDARQVGLTIKLERVHCHVASGEMRRQIGWQSEVRRSPTNTCKPSRQRRSCVKYQSSTWESSGTSGGRVTQERDELWRGK